MGKDATKDITLESQDQQGEQQQFKDEQAKIGLSSILTEQSPGLELREPVGGSHGDKWHDVLGEQFKTEEAPIAMEAPDVGGFHGDKWKDLSRQEEVVKPQKEEWSDLPPIHTEVHKAANIDSKEDFQFRGGVTKSEALEAKKKMLAELTSHAPTSDHVIFPSELHKEHADLEDKTAAETLKSAEKAKKSKKDQHLKSQKEEEFKGDKGLIPHEHLKKEEPLLATEHISGGHKEEDDFRDAEKDEKMLKKQAKKEKKDKKKKEKDLTPEANLVEAANFNKDFDKAQFPAKDEQSGFQQGEMKTFDKDLDKAQFTAPLKDEQSGFQLNKDLDKTQFPPKEEQFGFQAAAPLKDEQSGFQPGFEGDIMKTEIREAKKEFPAEHAPASELHPATHIHDGRTFKEHAHHDDMPHAHFHTHHEPNPLDALPLPERVVAGVHAGDPLSTETLKSVAEKITKSKRKSEGDLHFKDDKGLIPHEHLKKENLMKEDALLASERDAMLHASPVLDLDKTHFAHKDEQAGFQSEFPDREAKEMHAEHAPASELHFKEHAHHDEMPHAFHSHHEPNPLDELPLPERVVAGVHAGDPLSAETLKSVAEKVKKSKKDKKKSETLQDQHLKSDKGLIPHEHLKKGDSLLATEHISGPIEQKEEFKDAEKHEKMLKKQAKKEKKEKQKKEKALTPEAHLVESADINKEAQMSKDLYRDDPLIVHPPVSSAFMANKETVETKFDQSGAHQDAVLASDMHKEAHADDQTSGKKAGIFEKIKEKLGMKKDEELLVGEGHGHVEHQKEAHGHVEHQKEAHKGHEIATIKIPGIESGDRAAQEMVNHQAKAKKELNAELKGHVIHDHIAPSEIHGHAHTHESAMDAQATKDQILAKSELNSAIKHFAGDHGVTDHIVPSEISELGHQHDAPQTQPHGEFQPEKLAGATEDAVIREHILAKKDLNAEIKGLGEHSIMPSEIVHKDEVQPGQELRGETLAGLSGTGDAVMKDNILAKQDLNAEIESMASSGAILPSEIAHKQGEQFQHEHELQGEKLLGSETKDMTFAGQEKEASAETKQFGDQLLPELPSANTQLLKDEGFFDAKKADLLHDQMQAKKEVLADIKDAPTFHDQILPSEIAHASAEKATIHDGAEIDDKEIDPARDITVEEHRKSMSEKLKEKVSHAAAAVKDTLHHIH